jgi:adenylyltransferase/sulfurtransferase
VLGVLPGVVGTLQATEAIKLITGAGEVLAGRLLIYDALRTSFRVLRLPQRHDQHQPITRLIDYEEFCNPVHQTDITPTQLSEKIAGGEDVVLIDVREPYEWQAGHIEAARHIPMAQVPNRLAEIPKDKEVVMICRSGGRSGRAQEFLMRQHGYTRVKNLLGGMQRWKRDVDPKVTVA